MALFEFVKTEFDEVILINDFFYGDNRGAFTKTFERDIYAQAGIDFHVNETFFTVSQKNVIRGLHFQIRYPQIKLVSVINGAAWDVIVDLRPNSKTYLKSYTCYLSAENHSSLYVPKGFAHGFASLEDHTVMFYSCEGKYDKETDTGIRFDDPDINILWPISEDMAIHSERDLKLPSYKEYLSHPMNI